MSSASGRWIFGYGSLVWRPAFPFVERRAGHIEGWRRRFCQASPDHRGVPSDPGRVVTLLADRSATCHGMAYRVADDAWSEVLARLDVREQNGYARHDVVVRELGGRGELGSALVYIATPDNPSFRVGESLAEIAAVVRRAVGPSGDNREYVARLHEALAAMGAPDPHVSDLVAEIARQDRVSPTAAAVVEPGRRP